MPHLALLCVLCFLDSFILFTSFQAALHVLGAHFSRQFYWKVQPFFGE
jgi:hypothetical protein